MSGKHVEVADHAPNIAQDVGKEPRLNNHANNNDHALIGGHGVKISIANSARCGDHPIESIHVLLHYLCILQILQMKPGYIIVWPFVVCHAVENARDPMRDENNHCTNIEEAHNQVSLLTNYEHLKGLHELWDFDEANQPKQSKIPSHSYETHEFRRLKSRWSHLVEVISNVQERNGYASNYVYPEIALRIISADAWKVHYKGTFIIESSEKVEDYLNEEPNIDANLKNLKWGSRFNIEAYYEGNVKGDHQQYQERYCVNRCPEVRLWHN